MVWLAALCAVGRACTIPVVTGNVLIVDDHASFRASARRLLEDAGFTVVGEADSGLSAIAAVEELRPGVVLLDVQLPDIDGFDVAERLMGQDDAPAVVLTSNHDVSDFGEMIVSCGARGFLEKVDLSGPAIEKLLH
jgi:DNA-binding NarL/FixJ family response regulator